MYIIKPEKTAIKNGVSKSAKMIVNNHNKNERVLDYGCGKLRNSNFLLEQGYTVSIIDTKEQLDSLDKEQLSKFNKIYEHNSINLKDKYDVILCSFVLNVIEDEEDRIKVINNINELLTIDGVAYIEVRGEKSLNYTKFKKSYKDGYIVGKSNIKTFQIPFNYKKLLHLFVKCCIIYNIKEINSENIIMECRKKGR